MNLQQIAPFNWLKRENDGGREFLPTTWMSDPLLPMHQEMDRMFKGFFGNDRPAGGSLLLRPNVDIAESKKAYHISAEVPGIDPKDVDLEVEGDTLIMSGEKRQEAEKDDEGFHRVERTYGKFCRVLTLPEDAKVDGIKADFKNGVLKITVPRVEHLQEPKTKKIRIET